jgi:hypothetical protein
MGRSVAYLLSLQKPGSFAEYTAVAASALQLMREHLVRLLTGRRRNCFSEGLFESLKLIAALNLNSQTSELIA